MPLSRITVNVGEGGLGRRPANQDKVSGIIFYNNTLPAGFSTTERTKLVYSLEEAVGLGIVDGSVAHDEEHYQISEYFRLQPQGEIYIHYAAVPAGAYDYSEINTIVNFAQGRIRLLGVYAVGDTFTGAKTTTIQALVTLLDAAGYNLSVLYAADMSGIATGWGAADDLRALNNRKVSVIAIQDGGGAGAAIATAKSRSVPALGACLGVVSKKSVSDDPGYRRNFNLSNGSELEVLALANDDLVSALSSTALGAIKDKGYTIGVKSTRISGSFLDRMPTAIALNSDFAFIQNNQVVDKAIRLVSAAVEPELNASLLLNDDGTLSDDVIAYFEDLADGPLEGMVNDNEASAAKATIDPTQNVLSTDKLVISIKIVPFAYAEEIVINIGLAANLN